MHCIALLHAIPCCSERHAPSCGSKTPSWCWLPPYTLPGSVTEDIPIAFDSCRQGPRGIRWRSDRPAEVYWIETQVGPQPAGVGQT
jgi:hypothetical protein